MSSRLEKRSLARTQPAIGLFCAVCAASRHWVARAPRAVGAQRCCGWSASSTAAPTEEMQRKPSTAAAARNSRFCPAVTHQEWGPQGGVRGADQAARIPAEVCCAAGEGGGHHPAGGAYEGGVRVPRTQQVLSSSLRGPPEWSRHLPRARLRVRGSNPGRARARPQLRCQALSSLSRVVNSVAHAPRPAPGGGALCGGGASSPGEGLPDTFCAPPVI